MKDTLRILKCGLLCAVLSLIFSSCMELIGENQEETIQESVKDISGEWQIKKAFRNELDITEMMDFTQFRITFSEDHTYQVSNYLPFLVRNTGEWHLDDPQYPFYISMTPTGGEALNTEFDFPIANGDREIRLIFSPGCSNNAYEYVLERVKE
ncbi:DUF5004 domain-containing protein [Echinicola marina]|uniref:DUF5004 domain-containing protein n=1 Tax=Echinicola marina TaxID=2859768 RepID=UPI001CF6AA19|nr:DUF5004 domain-containing protein [Echinicola marina]UCS93363.1 DUF5004 domain-containing protein [Echinicola marina]